MKLSYTFTLNETFPIVWDHRWGTMDQFCYSDPNQGHVLTCEGKSRDRGWDIVTRYSFYEAGFIRDIDFLTKNVSTTKYYERIVDFDEEEEEVVVENSTRFA